MDKIGPDRYLAAHIGQDRVLVYNATSETVDWGWNAKTAYNVSSGGTIRETGPTSTTSNTYTMDV